MAGRPPGPKSVANVVSQDTSCCTVRAGGLLLRFGIRIRRYRRGDGTMLTSVCGNERGATAGVLAVRRSSEWCALSQSRVVTASRRKPLVGVATVLAAVAIVRPTNPAIVDANPTARYCQGW